MRILVVEDEVKLAEGIARILRKQNYAVDLIHDGHAGLDEARSGIYDLLLLDVMLPGLDGNAIVQRMRLEGINTPVLMLSARSESSDKVNGLDVGADDYLAKPFEVEELLARIRAVLRRRGQLVHDLLFQFEDLELNPGTLKLICGARELKLNLKESQLLQLLMQRKRAVTTKEMIIEKLWGFHAEAEYNNVEVYVSFLRKKLTFLQSVVAIQTIRGVGYVLEAGT